MKFRITPMTRGSSRHPAETSRLAPKRDSDSIFRQWQKLRTSMRQQNQQASAQAAARVALGRPESQWAPDLMHPFKLYRAPLEDSRVRALIDPLDRQKMWRTFRVRYGYAMTTTAQGIGVQYTDRCDQPWQDALVSKADGTPVNQSLVGNVIVPEGLKRFYFWCELSADASEALLRWHSQPYEDTYVDEESADAAAMWHSDNPWAGWPVPDSQHFLIGWVDTLSQAKVPRALPRQVQFGDIVAGGGGPDCLYG